MSPNFNARTRARHTLGVFYLHCDKLRFDMTVLTCSFPILRSQVPNYILIYEILQNGTGSFVRIPDADNWVDITALVDFSTKASTMYVGSTY